MRLPSFVLASSLLALVSGCGDDSSDEGSPPDAAPPAVEPGWSSYAAFALATDAEYLYAGGSELVRIPLDGGEPQTLFSLPDGRTASIESIHPGQDHVVFVMREEGQYERFLQQISKSGGPVTTLSSSEDQRSFLGVTVAGDQVYFSSYTDLYRVPLAGGSTVFVGESPEYIQYWVYSPTIVGDDLYWAEGFSLFKIPKTARAERGTSVGYYGLDTRIIGSGGVGEPLAVMLVNEFLGLDDSSWFIEVDPVTGDRIGDITSFGRKVTIALATDEAAWGASFDGVVRLPRTGGNAELLTNGPVTAIAASGDAVFAATETGITRISR
jgi:hypothetical protein